ncbi:MAG: methyltransferase domain-containing protein [Planctomycetota bacterium]
MDSFNVYEDAERAAAYARVEFPGTYYLAFRDLPAVIRTHARGTRAIDIGCGAGRSTRFLVRLGFPAVGVDIAANMLAEARRIDPGGDYRWIGDGDLSAFGAGAFDVALAAFTFDNIPTRERKIALFREIARVLGPAGVLVNLVSSPDIYRHEWASFTTRDFPENAAARSGDTVRIVMKDAADRRPVLDILCTDEDYREIYRRSGLEVVLVHRPLARADEPYPWIDETRIAPWVIYVLAPLTRGEG